MNIRNTLSRIGTISILSLTLFAFQNCGSTSGLSSSSTSPPSNKVDEVAIQQSVDLLKSLVSQDLSCSQDSDCLAIGIGHKSCGGFTGHVIASRLNPSIDQISSLADEITRAARAANESSGAYSTCDVYEVPSASCVSNSCQ